MSDDYQKIKVLSPFKITLFRRKSDSSPNIYYYFTLNKKSYKGSTGSHNIETAEKFSIKKYLEIHRHKGKDINKSAKFEIVAVKFLKWKQPFVAKRTFSEYSRQVKFLMEFFQGRDIESFTLKDYHEYDDWRREYYTLHKRKRKQTYIRDNTKIKGCSFKDCGNTTINREVGLLVSILKYSQDILQLNQSKKIPGWKKLPENIRKYILSKSEYNRLRDYWLNKNPFYWDIISFVEETGVRYPSEIMKLTWGDVNFDNSFIIIRDRKGKPNKDMSIPLVDTAREILEKLKSRENVSTNRDDFVFVNDKGKQVKNIRSSFKKSLIECGINNKNITMYSLRHQFTTRIILTRPDIPHKVLAHVLGHSDTSMIDKHYGHLNIDSIVNIFKRPEEFKSKDNSKVIMKRALKFFKKNAKLNIILNLKWRMKKINWSKYMKVGCLKKTNLQIP